MKDLKYGGRWNIHQTRALPYVSGRSTGWLSDVLLSTALRCVLMQVLLSLGLVAVCARQYWPVRGAPYSLQIALLGRSRPRVVALRLFCGTHNGERWMGGVGRPNNHVATEW